MIHAPHSLRRRSGFTLIEMLIVAALIVIFSTIAIFSMQELMESSRRKAAIADLRTVAHTLAASYMDLGFYPKVGYLGYGLHGSSPLVGVERGTATSPELPPGFDTLGHLASDNTPFARRVRKNWGGRYLPDSSPRSVLSYSPYAYTAKMRVPNPDPNGDDEIMAWPCDPWGNPYVVYLLHKSEDPSVDEWWLREPTEKANYLAIVVSYGRNQIPGGSVEGEEITDQIRADAEDYKLYRRDDTLQADFVALVGEDITDANAYNENRLNALYHEWGYLSPANVPGILDKETDTLPGSDDIVVSIP